MHIRPFRGIVPTLGARAYVDPAACVIGDVHLGEDSSVWPGCVVRGDVNHIRIGARTNIQDGTIVHVNSGAEPAIIGDGVTIGHGCIIHACTLEDGAFVGMGATVLDRAVIEGGGMLAAGALLTPGKRVKHGELWAGSPARFLRPLTEADIAGFAKTAPHYSALAMRHRASLG